MIVDLVLKIINYIFFLLFMKSTNAQPNLYFDRSRSLNSVMGAVRMDEKDIGDAENYSEETKKRIKKVF